MNRILNAALLVTLILVAAGCSAGSSAQTSPPSVDPDAVRISAKDNRFSTDSLSAPAGEPFQIVFENQEGAPHNVAIYRDSSAAEKVFVEDPFSGPATVVYGVPALQAGMYFFRCDVHPDMNGGLTVG